ncbi:hypothetical protein ATCC90586_005923 [Pythium insidiosum]|nr:hypothetical protein ATCC90586_005923 [Pythium insidiosum]
MSLTVIERNVITTEPVSSAPSRGSMSPTFSTTGAGGDDDGGAVASMKRLLPRPLRGVASRCGTEIAESIEMCDHEQLPM